MQAENCFMKAFYNSLYKLIKPLKNFLESIYKTQNIKKLIPFRWDQLLCTNKHVYDFTAITVRPLYVPQFLQAWCANLYSPHCGQG